MSHSDFFMFDALNVFPNDKDKFLKYLKYEQRVSEKVYRIAEYYLDTLYDFYKKKLKNHFKRVELLESDIF